MGRQLGPVKVACSYHSEDKELRDRLETALATLKRQELIKTWDNRQILAGEQKVQEIERNLDDAELILLLLSPDYMASDQCYKVEMTRALERYNQRTAYIIPIILRSVNLLGTPLDDFQRLPRNEIPVKRWKDSDDAFTHIEEEIRQVVERIHKEDLPSLFKSENTHSHKMHEDALIDQQSLSSKFTTAPSLDQPIHPVQVLDGDQREQPPNFTTPPGSDQPIHPVSTQTKSRSVRSLHQVLTTFLRHRSSWLVGNSLFTWVKNPLKGKRRRSKLFIIIIGTIAVITCFACKLVVYHGNTDAANVHYTLTNVCDLITAGNSLQIFNQWTTTDYQKWKYNNNGVNFSFKDLGGITTCQLPEENDILFHTPSHPSVTDCVVYFKTRDIHAFYYIYHLKLENGKWKINGEGEITATDGKINNPQCGSFS